MLRRWAEALGVSLSDGAVRRLGGFVTLLEEWNERIHLTGERSREGIIQKHVVDAFAIVPLLPDVGPIVDIGAGAGFPGIVLAAVRPTLDIVLIDSRRRPVSFLREVIRTLPLPHARAVQCRAEDAARDPALARRARLVVARALRLDTVLALARPLLAADGTALAMQTPRALERAEAMAAAAGFRLASVCRYELQGGTERALLLFEPATR